MGDGVVAPAWFLYLDHVRGFGPAAAGLSFTTRAAGLIALAPIAGWLADRHGPRGVVLAGTLCTMAGATGLALSPWPTPVFVASLALGIGVACTAPTTRGVLLQSVPPPQRSRATTASFLMWTLGLGGGGLLGGVLADPVHPITFQLLFGALGALGVLTRLVNLPAMPRRRAMPHAPADSASGRLSLGRAFLCYLALVSLLQLAGDSQTTSGLPGLATTLLDVSPRTIGFALAVNTAIVLLSYPWTRRLGRTVRPARSMGAVALLWALGWTQLELTTLAGRPALSAASIIVFYALFALGDVLLAAAAWPLVAELAPAGALGRYLGLDLLTRQIGSAAGPMLSAAFIAAAAPIPLLALLTALCLGAAALTLRLHRLLDIADPVVGKDSHDSASLVRRE